MLTNSNNNDTDNSRQTFLITIYSVHTAFFFVLLAVLFMNHRKVTEKKIDKKVRFDPPNSEINKLLENPIFAKIKYDLEVTLAEINDDIKGKIKDVDYLKKRDEIIKMIHIKLSAQISLSESFIGDLWKNFFPVLIDNVNILYDIRIHQLLKNESLAEVASIVRAKLDLIDELVSLGEKDHTANNIEHRKTLYKSIQETLISQIGGAPAEIKKYWDEYKIVGSSPASNAVSGPKVAELQLLVGRDS